MSPGDKASLTGETAGPPWPPHTERPVLTKDLTQGPGPWPLPPGFTPRLLRRHLGKHRLLGQTFEPFCGFNFFAEISHFFICLRIILNCLSVALESLSPAPDIKFLLKLVLDGVLLNRVGWFPVLGVTSPFQWCSGPSGCDVRRLLISLNLLF